MDFLNKFSASIILMAHGEQEKPELLDYKKKKHSVVKVCGLLTITHTLAC